jgi:transcriptional regulator with XRE-family HTH domain
LPVSRDATGAYVGYRLPWYTLLVAMDRGVAWRLWEMVDRLLTKRELSQKWLVETSGISAMTINRLRTQKKLPRPRTVHALADALGIDQEEAEIAAGLLPPRREDRVPTRVAIMHDDDLTEDQKAVMIEIADTFTALNRLRGAPTRPDHRSGPNRSPGDGQQAM